jgi:hypothetical protein
VILSVYFTTPWEIGISSEAYVMPAAGTSITAVPGLVDKEETVE